MKPSSLILLNALVPLLLLIANPKVEAQTYVMHIPGLNGSTTISGYEDLVEIAFISFSAARPLVQGGGGGGGGGNLAASPINIGISAGSEAIPRLFEKVVRGDVSGGANKITITALQIDADGGPGSVKPLMTLEIEGQWLSIEQSGNAGAKPFTQFTLQPSRIEMTTYQYDSDGNESGSDSYEYDVIAEGGGV